VSEAPQSSVVAIYGGSFNPPHVGHAMVARWLTWTKQADAVWLVPVYRHAFEGRHDKTLAPFDERVSWCRAFADDLGPGVEVCTVEADLPVPSFTIDTLRHLSGCHPELRFRLVVGADALPHLPAWRNWDAIEREFSPLMVGRQGHPVPGSDGVDFPNVSSTDVRARLKDGRAISHLLTAGVRTLVEAYSSEPKSSRGRKASDER